MHCNSTTIINRSVKEVWQYFTDPNHLKEWLTGFERLEHLSGTPGTVGATSKQHYTINGKPFELLETITKRVEFRQFSGTMSNEMLHSTIHNYFTGLEGKKTEVRSDTTVTFKGFMRVLSPLMKKSFQQRQDADLQKLKLAIESR